MTEADFKEADRVAIDTFQTLPTPLYQLPRWPGTTALLGLSPGGIVSVVGHFADDADPEATVHTSGVIGAEKLAKRVFARSQLERRSAAYAATRVGLLSDASTIKVDVDGRTERVDMWSWDVPDGGLLIAGMVGTAAVVVHSRSSDVALDGIGPVVDIRPLLRERRARLTMS